MKTTTDQRLPMFETLENRQLLSAGQLDSTFGDGGIVVTNNGLGSGRFLSMQGDGKIVAAVQGDGNASGGFNLVRYNSDGSIDTSYGDDGFAHSQSGIDFQAMVVQPDGKLVLGGTSYSEETNGHYTVSTVLTRYNTDGTLDTDFGDDGVISMPGDTYDGTNGGTVSPGNVKLAVQADGKVLFTQILGDDRTVSGPDLNIFRLTDSGVLDDTFGDNGVAVVELGLDEVPKDMAIQADGKIVVAIDGMTVSHAGGGFSYTTDSAYLVRLNTDGTTDTDFGTGGAVTIAHTGYQMDLYRLAIGLDGKLLVEGEEMANDRSTLTIFLTRYNTDGSIDTDFGTGGRVNLDAGTNYGDILVQPDGKLLLSGGKTASNGKPGAMVQRRNEDGSLDTDFGDGGTKVLNVGTQSDLGGGLALQQDGSILLSAYVSKEHGENSNDFADFGLIRLEGDAGSAGSAHASLRRGKDQQTTYLGKNKLAAHQRSPKRIAMELAAQAAGHHRSSKRIAMEIAAKVQQALADGSHRSPKRLSMEVAAAIFGTTEI